MVLHDTGAGRHLFPQVCLLAEQLILHERAVKYTVGFGKFDQRRQIRCVVVLRGVFKEWNLFRHGFHFTIGPDAIDGTLPPGGR